MRVVACAPGGAVRIEERLLPAPGPGEMTLRVRRAGLCGTDLVKLRRGTVADGAVLGHEIVGTVEAVGAGAVGFAPGDRVAVPHHVACGRCELCRRGAETQCPAFRENLLVPGGFSEVLLVRERAVRLAAFGLPAHVPDDAAVFLEPAACVLRGVRRCGLESTPTPARAAVLGAGSMGLLHLLVLRAVVPDVRVTVVDPVSERRARALELGADAALAPGETLPDGLGADAVFDTAGGAAALDAGLDLLRPGGAVVLFAHAAPGERAGFELDAFFHREARLIATYSSSLAEQRDTFRLMATRRLDPSSLVTHRLPLSRFAEAVALAATPAALKVLLVPDGMPEDHLP
jgi:L-iditol 2-dehydrogenase